MSATHRKHAPIRPVNATEHHPWTPLGTIEQEGMLLRAAKRRGGPAWWFLMVFWVVPGLVLAGALAVALLSLPLVALGLVR